MEEYYEKRLKGLIPFTGLMSMGLASQIGFFMLICFLQGNSITSVILFIAGIMATTISYLISVLGGVPLPGPKKREESSKVPFSGTKKQEKLSVAPTVAVKAEIQIKGPESGVGLPTPHWNPPTLSKKERWLKDHIRFALFMAMMLAAQIGLFAIFYALQANGISLETLILFISGIVGTTSAYTAVVSGGVPPPAPKLKSGVLPPEPSN
jgi:hypothetical protein